MPDFIFYRNQKGALPRAQGSSGTAFPRRIRGFFDAWSLRYMFNYDVLYI